MSVASIRRAGPADAGLLARLHAASFTEGWDAPSIATLLAGPGGFGLVAGAPDAEQGFAILQSVPPESELLSVGVLPSARRLGVAREVLRHAAAELLRVGSEVMFLDVAANNDAAIGLYRSLGFGDIARRARYYNGSVDAIVMQAPLARVAA